MIDEDALAGMTDGSVADLVAATRRRAIEAETEVLVLAGAWGRRFEIDPDRPTRESGAVPGPARQVGGPGTPVLNGDAVIEFGTLTGTTTGTAGRLIADALDLEHRLPRIWARVRRGEVVVWQARRIAAMTRHLSTAAAGYVDRAVARFMTSLPWGRLASLVEAKIIESDPTAARARAAAADADRFVRTGRTTEEGLATIFARVDAGDAVWFCAMIDRLAAILAQDGDPDPVDVRRSKAIGIIADPPLATQMLATHGHPTTTCSSDVTRQTSQDQPSGPGSDAAHDDACGAQDQTRPTDESANDTNNCDQTPDSPERTADLDGHRGAASDPDAAPSTADRSADAATEPPPAEQAWPDTDPWDQHTWIPEPLWQAIHRRHRDDPGPPEPATTTDLQPPGTPTPPGTTTPSGEACSPGEGCPDDPAAAGEVCPDPPDPAGLPDGETRRGRAADPTRAADTLTGLLHDPATRRRLAPTAVIYIHLAADVFTGRLPGVARLEASSHTPAGPISIDQVRRFLRTDRVNITIKPVIDLNTRPPAADAWEIPAPIRERTRLRLPAEAFPWAASTSARPDLDHTLAYRPPERGGPPGQTTETRLGPLSRRHHNAKTRGRWQVRQPAPGVFVWRSPHHQTLIVDADGTHDHGRGPFADQLWNAALACPPAEPDPPVQPLSDGPLADLHPTRIPVQADTAPKAA